MEILIIIFTILFTILIIIIFLIPIFKIFLIPIFKPIFKKNNNEIIIKEENIKENEITKIQNEFLENIEKKEYIMTYTEKIFFEVLNEYLKNKNYILFTKVRLADVFKIKKWRWYNWLFTYNRIKSKHIDFLITDINWKILKVIELDDYRHSKNNESKSDMTKNIIFNTFWIDFIRFEVWKKRNIEKLNLI